MIHPTAVVGDPPEARGHRPLEASGRSRVPGHAPNIAEDATLEAFVTVDAGVECRTFIGARVWLMKHVHVGHDATVMQDCELAPGTVVGGYAFLGPGVKCGVNATILPRKHVGAGARIGAGAVVTKDVPAGETWVGNPARPLKKEAAGLEAFDPGLDPKADPLWIEWYDRSRA